MITYCPSWFSEGLDQLHVSFRQLQINLAAFSAEFALHSDATQGKDFSSPKQTGKIKPTNVYCDQSSVTCVCLSLYCHYCFFKRSFLGNFCTSLFQNQRVQDIMSQSNLINSQTVLPKLTLKLLKWKFGKKYPISSFL